MPEAILDEISHRRYNPLRGSWILVSPHRTKRPWQGAQENPSKTVLPEYDPSCYLCPGNKRAQGDQNPQYERTFVFVNDYSAVREEQQEYIAPSASDATSHLLRAEATTGKCYVLTFSKSHNRTLADLEPEDIVSIVRAWTQIYRFHLSSNSPLLADATALNSTLEELDINQINPRAQYQYMQIFENKGAAMGCSNPHPHGQIWTVSGIPEEPALEMSQLQKYRVDHAGAHMLEAYVALEMKKRERLVYENESFVVICPWWATWPFETILLTKKHKRALTDLSDIERLHLAQAIGDITRRYDNLFETHFPYSMGLHQAPLEGASKEIEACHLHIHFYPPLLRSATVRKFLVGYELLAEPQRDITPEQAATKLRGCGGELYRRLL